MSKYRAKSINKFDGTHITIIQKKVFGMFWVDCQSIVCDYYKITNVATIGYIQDDSLTVTNGDDVKNVLKWLESNKNHRVFKDALSGEIIYAFPVNKLFFSYHASNSIYDAEKLEHKIKKDDRKHNVSQIVIWKYNKNTDDVDVKIVKK